MGKAKGKAKAFQGMLGGTVFNGFRPFFQGRVLRAVRKHKRGGTCVKRGNPAPVVFFLAGFLLFFVFFVLIWCFLLFPPVFLLYVREVIA